MGFDATTLWVIIVVLLIGVGAILVLALRGSNRQPPLPPPDVLKPVPAAVAERAQAVIAQGKRIQAIKEIREATGCGLKEAKDIADTLYAGQPVPTVPAPGDETATLAERVRELREQKRMVDAIRLVTEQTGMNEAEAARMIESLD